jgi:hypothetical protein
MNIRQRFLRPAVALWLAALTNSGGRTFSGGFVRKLAGLLKADKSAQRFFVDEYNAYTGHEEEYAEESANTKSALFR